MKRVFPYFQRGSNFYPVVDITLFGKTDDLTIKALLDSGASFSVFRPEIATQLGITIEKGGRIYLEGIGGRILGYIHNINAECGGKKFRLRLIFSREFTVSFNLLGRDNFFSTFKIIFDEKNRKVILY